MTDCFTKRTELLVGEDNLKRIRDARVIVFGLGGVGSFAAEALVRAGVGNITVVDFDTVDITNINRQLPALHSTVGRQKSEVVRDRLIDINPALNIRALPLMLDGDNIDEFELEGYDYCVDAIDMVSSKLLLIKKCDEIGLKIISSMGMGFRLDPTAVGITDIYKTKNDPLARVMRRKLKELGVKRLTVVYSEEIPRKTKNDTGGITASSAFVPSTAGLAMASYIIRSIIY